MTIRTGSAQVTAVDVVAVMATGAFCRRFSMGKFRFVAAAAAFGCVGSEQRELCQLMVEQARLQSDDVCLATLVLRMAAAALSASGFSVAGMKSSLIVQIGGDVLVAIQAQLFLRAAIEQTVAGAAGLFGIRMRLCHRAGHDQTFQARAASGSCCQQ